MTHSPDRTILVVDDDPDVRFYASVVLQDGGFSVACAADGGEGLAEARRMRPALICLDIEMPGLTGMKVFRELRRDPELRAVPLVIVTGLPDPFRRFILGQRQLPAPEGYVSKPFHPQTLVATVHRVLSERRAIN